ncbi:DUF4127 family protein [Aceticella autotrophica]|uniref:DUF4127 family protein n=1 Tax=Aceticella autotrophica TaxID=2755338 RepID=A0A975GA22_9THEO|nr:DUF4127 family protein [Aceticella autotrophica]QSZ27054.1 DUF4127 family protein [Aceticella autotrophica]
MKKIITFIIVFIITISAYCNKTSYNDKTKYIHKDKIVFVPLDTRPVSLQNVEILSKAGGYELLVPPFDSLDNYIKPGNQDKLYDWLQGVVVRPDVYAVVISTNQFISGGLIASRNYKNVTGYKKAINKLKNIINLSRDKKCILISIMPRVSNTLEEQDTVYAANSLNIGYFNAIKTDILSNNMSDIEGLKSRMPSNLFNYMYVIAQEAVINYEIASGLKSNAILTIGIDDTTMKSMLNYAYDDLKKNGIKKYKNIYMLHGADEISLMTIAKLANGNQQAKPSFEIAYEKHWDDRMNLPYEGGTLKEITEEKIHYIGGDIEKDAKNIIYIHSNKDSGITINSIINTRKKKNQNLGIADVAMTNGGDPHLVEEILTNDNFKKIDAYSGWNTPSNTIGTVISELSIKSNLDTVKDKKIYNERDKAYLTFLFIRYADDYIYQSIVRNEMYKWAQSQGEDKYNLKNTNEADSVLQQKMNPYFDRLIDIFNRNTILRIKKAKAVFPWNRMFEIKVEAE